MTFLFSCMTGNRLIMYCLSFNTYFDPSLDLFFFFLSSSFPLHIGNLFICSCRATDMIASLLLISQYFFSSHNVLSLPRPVCSCQLWPVNFFSLCLLLYYAMAMLSRPSHPFYFQSSHTFMFLFPFTFLLLHSWMGKQSTHVFPLFFILVFAIIVLRASFERLGLILFLNLFRFSLEV